MRAWPKAMPLDSMAGPFAAAAVLPAAVMMAGLVTVWGVGVGLASAFVAMRRERFPAPGNDGAEAPAVPTLRLVVARAEPVVAAPKPATPKEGGVKAPGPGVPPKPSKPGGAPPKPKAVAAVPLVAATKPATPKDGGQKTPGPGVPPKPSKPGGAPPKPKAVAAKPVAARRKARPAVTVAPLKIETTSTAKGISLPRLSIQNDKPDAPAKD